MQGVNDWIDVQRIVCWIGDGRLVALDRGIERLHLLLLLGLLFCFLRPVLEHVLVLDLQGFRQSERCKGFLLLLIEANDWRYNSCGRCSGSGCGWWGSSCFASVLGCSRAIAEKD